ncbi:MAG: hypothetical protein ACTSUE_06440 [Promethearchaeota archaeon]
MLNQLPTDPVGIVLLIVAIVLLFLFNYLAVRGVESKTLASKKKMQCFFVAVLGVLAFLIIIWIWGVLGSAVNGWISESGFSWPNGTYLSFLGPIFAFLAYIVLVHWLIDVSWKNCVIIGILALLLLALFLTFTPFVGDYLNFAIT